MKICKTIVNGIAPAITHPRAWAALAALALGLLPLSAQAVTPQTTIQPSTGITALIETNGIFSDMATIDLFAGNFAPGGSAIASGQLLPISSNTALFSLIGTYYGGNGSSNFALPNLNGRAIIGTGQGLGLSNRFLGETTGVPQVTLSNTQMPVSVGGLGQAFTNVQPSLAVNYYISAAGVYPTGGGGGGNAQPFLGQIFATASAASPGSGGLSNSWIPADGRLLPISQNTALFSILGTTYGGNGTSTFGLPDLRGRAAIGAGNGPGLTPQTLGEVLGTESTTLSQSNLPAPYGVSLSYSNMQPTQAVSYLIALQGIFPTQGGGGIDNADPVIGQIIEFAGNFAPPGYALCEGQLLPIDQNTALFSVIGTTFGGDGQTTFALPDLRGRIPVGQDGGATWNLGQEAGVESLSLTAAQIPALPEPASLSLLTLGACGLLARRRVRATH